ncbi:hypothetical protein VD0004_g3428 [Verticillium dahliae]|nr:hypothetical protein VD0004_g3428 [Verticillium dahliae]
MSTAAQRIQGLAAQLPGGADQAALARLQAKDPKDVSTVKKSGIDPKLVEEIVLGNVLHKDAPYTLRASGFAAGFPATTAVSHVSRWCSSGLLAVESVAQKVALGSIDIGIAVGAESMSNNPDNGAPKFPDGFMANPLVEDATRLMPWTSENVARDFNISRERQDEYAAASFQKAEAAQNAGFMGDEIVPVTTTWKDPKTGEIQQVTVDKDDGIRAGTTKEGLSKIRSAFPQWPPATTTGGNASQITDGAAAVLIMRREVAERLQQPILGKFVLSTVVGVEPRVMGVGPAYAIPKLLSKVGLSKEAVDIFEINEAFASMLVYCTEALQLDPARLNPRGGAIAFGHPLGCTGARQIVTALSELKRTGGKIAVTSMCVGTRKVRCNVALTGSPCSNCRLDHETCVVPERSNRRWSRESNYSSSTAALLEQHRSNLRKPRSRRPDGATNFDMPRSPRPDIHQHTGASETHIVLTRPPSPATENAPRDDGPPPRDRDEPSPWHEFRHSERAFTTTVPISAYPFLTVSNLHRLPPEDINFLELKKCLRVPSRVYLDEILQQYFRYVHPFFPLVNEATFWDMYHGVDPGKSPERFSLLVLQAMLFTACSFVSANTLEQLGYSSVRAARRIMYGRAKMLYDFETEKSQLHMAQAALLLSYWTPPFEEAAIKPNTGWLRAAIENARSVRAHQWNFNPAKPGSSSEVQMSLRKLWSLGLDSNTTFSLTFDDFKDEIHDSRVYDPRTKKQLIVAFLGLAEMCAQVVAMSALLFPFDNSDAGAKRQIGLVEENSKILMSKKTLDRWHGKTVECLSDPFNQSRDHPSIALFTNLQHIYYFSARIAFANRLMLSCYDNEGAAPRDVVHLREEVQESTVSIGKCLATLTELNLDRYLPVSVVPCIALPLALNSNTTPTSPKARIFSEAMKTYSRLYEGVDGLARAIRVIVNQERDSQLVETSEISTTTTLVDRLDAFQSGCYMRLALTIDLSLSRGNLPDEADLPVTIRSSSSPESLGHPATGRPLPDSCTGGSPKSDMDSSVSDGNTPRAQPTTNEWLDPNISLPPLSQADEEDGLWHLAELSPGKTDYDMLESIIWSGLDDSMFS